MEFHLGAKRVRPASRGGAKAVAAYIAGETSADGVRINNPHSQSDIAFQGLDLPPGAHFGSAREMWSAADKAERTKTGEYQRRGGDRRPPKDGEVKRPAGPVLATHTDLALPWGTTEAQARQIIGRICKHLTDHHRVGVQWSCHVKDGRIDHAHFLWTSRTISDSGMGKKARTLNAIAMRKEGINPMKDLRTLASAAILEATGVAWDPRSFKERGIDQTPEPKIDRQELRRQKRQAKKEGQEGPTELEQTLTRRRALSKQRQALKAEQARPQPVMVYPATPAPAPAPATPPRPRLNLAQQLAAMRGAQEPARPAPALERTTSPAPTATVMPGDPPGAAPPPLVPAAQEEHSQPPPRPLPKPLNPFLDENNLIRDKEKLRLGATIIHGAVTKNTPLMQATLGLLTVMKGGWEAAQDFFDAVLLWAATPKGKETRAKFADEQPFTLAELETRTVQAEARAAARRRREEQAANQGGPEPQPKPRPRSQNEL